MFYRPNVKAKNTKLSDDNIGKKSLLHWVKQKFLRQHAKTYDPKKLTFVTYT